MSQPQPVNYRVVTAPPVYPVTLTEAKAWVRETVTTGEQDSLITRLIASHVNYAEKTITGRAFVQRQLQAFYRQWPGFCDGDANGYQSGWSDQQAILLPFAPLISVDQIDYTDIQGNAQTVDPADYQTDIYSEPGRVKPVWLKYWKPIRSFDFNPIRITYTCGYAAVGSPSDYTAAVPENLKEWLLRRVATAYESREGLIVDTRTQYYVIERDFVDGLIDDLVLGVRAL